MISTVRSLSRNKLVFRKLATTADPPRVLVGKNLLLFQHISAAKDDTALTEATKFVPTLDLHNIPSELSYLKGYLAGHTATAGGKFEFDPKAWQNLPFWEYVATEAKRDETWPFIVGAIVTWLLLGVGIPLALPKEGKKTSKYMQLLEGNAHKASDHGHDHH